MIFGKIGIFSFSFILCYTIIVLLCAQVNEATPLQSSWSKINAPHEFNDDFSTDYAKKIMRLAKAAEIKAYLNAKIDPCVDFYQFACGNWHHSNPAQLLSGNMTDKFRALSKAFDRRLINLLSQPENDNDMTNKIKIFYRACKIARADGLDYELSLKNIYEEFGEMPVLAGKNWNETSFKWWETIARIQNKYGKQILFSVQIITDIKNANETNIHMGPPNYDMSEGTRLKEAQLSEELKMHLGVDEKLAKITAIELIAFERELLSSGSKTNVPEPLLTMQSVGNFAITYADSFNVKDYLELALGSQRPESIYVVDERYFHNALEVIESKPKHIVANYVLWQLMKEFFVDDEKDLSEWCLKKTKNFFGKFVDNWIYSEYRNEGAENEISDLFDDMRTTFRDALRGNKLDWISNHTREFAITKLDAMNIVINSYDNENFTAGYASLELNPYEYVKNVEKVLNLNSHKTLEEKLFEINTNGKEDSEFLSFKPSYNRIENNIRIPVAFLQPRHFWSEEYPKAIKYATLGFLIAHQMIHGFDDEGQKFGKDGSEYIWWDKKSTYEYEERRKCFQAQYHSYEYGGNTLPESTSQSENIADNAGVKLAYSAYAHWLNQNKTNATELDEAETLPNLSFNNRQLFFISFAQLWCGDAQSLFKSRVASGDSHAPGMYRVIGSLSNFPEFSWIFKCRPDAPMSPHYKCLIY